MLISSSSNPQAKQLAAMLKKAKARNEADAYIVEGIRMVREIPKEDLIRVYVSESFVKNHPEWEAQATILADKVYKEISDTATPQGIMATVRQKHFKLKDLMSDKKKTPLFLILESVQDPGNLGTMFRMAEGAGATGLIMNSTTVDIYNPKVVRSTMGSVFRMPFIYTSDLANTIKELKAGGVSIYAAHLKGQHYYFEEDYIGATGIMIGNEAAGLSDEIASLADTYIKIPMDGQVESLNAAMAATILMYETKRQRLERQK